jgi:hypothetical protein
MRNANLDRLICLSASFQRNDRAKSEHRRRDNIGLYARFQRSQCRPGQVDAARVARRNLFSVALLIPVVSGRAISRPMENGFACVSKLLRESPMN